MSPRWVVAQVGARMHYAVPRLLHAAGALDRLYTDTCAWDLSARLLALLPPRVRPDAVRRLLARQPAGIPRELVTTFPSFARAYARRQRVRGGALAAHLWAGKRFAELVASRGLGSATGVYAFNSAALELLRHARARGMRATVEQTMAPHRVERELIARERADHPGWEPEAAANEGSREFAEREAEEWSAADVVLCGSQFVKDGVAACSGPVERCRVVPYGVDAPPIPFRRPPHDGPLRVLTIGAVGLRKGSPYVLAAARACAGRAVFRMVGPVLAAPERRAELASAVEVVGPVPRPEVEAHYRWADAFLLPSVCEGSATVIYEAMGWSLPIICTPSTGSVVRDGVEGRVVPARDRDALVEAIASFAADPAARMRMGEAARTTAEAHSVAAYRERLLRALEA